MKTRIRKLLSLLLSAALVCCLFAALAVPGSAASVVRTSQALKVDGVPKSCEIYNIDNSNYFKLRSIAALLTGTGSQFDVGFDKELNAVTVTTGAAYTPLASDLAIGADKSSTAVPSAQSVYIDGSPARKLVPWNIGGSNFFKLRELGSALGFGVDYDSASKTMLVESKEGAQPLPTTPIVYANSAPGTVVYANKDNSVKIDASNASSGYVMVSSTVAGSPKLVVMVTGPDGNTYRYYYTDTTGVYQAFPLTAGSGSYTIGVYQNLTGTKYATLHSATISAALSYANVPFIRPNFFVDYSAGTSCVNYASTVCAGATTVLEKIEKIYTYVVNNFTYDYDKAATVQTGYRPVLETVWASKKGICFDYAAVMTSMLRTQGIPSKLVVGYAGTTYHAWISVFTEETGWVEAVIYFNGSTWRFMDPTFASTGGASANDYITNDANYSAKYMY